MMATGPALAREAFDVLEAAIVDLHRAAGGPVDSPTTASDDVERVPGSPEPPD
jgi:hypothetical protein